MSEEKIKAIIQDYRDKKILTDRFLEKINYQLRNTSKFSNLNEDNRKLLLSIIKKHRDQIFERGGLQAINIQDEKRKIFGERFEENADENDRRDIAEILEMFKR